MGNTIRMHEEHKNNDEWLCMSNGGTSVLLTVLVLSGSRIAKIKREKELIIWLAEHDQNAAGLGTVGFDISGMPWIKGGFKSEKEFLIQVIEGAFAKAGWETLDHEPDEDIVFGFLSTFQKLVEGFREEFIIENSYRKWIALVDDPQCGIPKGMPKCSKHGAYLYYGGCIVCNDI